jgi:hypothetical protein
MFLSAVPKRDLILDDECVALDGATPDDGDSDEER